MTIFSGLLCSLVLVVFSSCSLAPPGGSPPGYDLGAPERFVMDEELHEISGIAMLHGQADSLYAIQDEEGQFFHFHLGARRWPSVKFGKRGDYEDLAVLDDSTVVVLRSDGKLFEFPLHFISNPDKALVRTYEDLLPEGEYEGLAADGRDRLIALCKKCKEDDQKDEASGYVLDRKDGTFTTTGHFLVDVTGVPMSTRTKRKIKFHPSALARHPLTRDWYILSSVNKVLLIADDQWKVKSSYQLNVNLFKQPEGLSFDSQGNMYVSNEGDEGDGNVLVFRYNQSTKYEKDRKNH